jgi:peptidoglycan/xylan/chitin deacetylase (PgdA/CDA1 family)
MKRKGYFKLIVLIFLFVTTVLILATFGIFRLPKGEVVGSKSQLEQSATKTSAQITAKESSAQKTESQESTLGVLLEQVENIEKKCITKMETSSIAPSNSTETNNIASNTKSNSNTKWELGKLYTSLPTKEHKVLLTIDDGPGNYTDEILDFLKSYNIKAIFFVSGDTVKRYHETLKREYEEGHEIGSHTYCHRNFYKLEKTSSLEEMKQTLISDLDKTEKNVKDIILEAKIRFLRMPEGYYRDWVGEIAMKYGYVTMNWSVGGDWFDKPDEEIIKMFKSAIKPGAIILLHDGRNRGKRALKILEEIVPYILSQGYSFADPKEFF